VTREEGRERVMEKTRGNTGETEDETRMSSLDAWKIKGYFVKI
jgi:hypothetical protein